MHLMDHNHVIKLSSGKVIELSNDEYNELVSALKEVVYIPTIPQPPYEKQWPSYPVWCGQQRNF